MLFYFVRHGETDLNRQRVLAGGGLDHPLNDEGHKQAQALARNIKAHISHPLHRIIVSQMQRAHQTAAYLAEALALPVEIRPEFCEWHLGEWEGRSYEEFMHLLLGDGDPQEGETRQDFYARVERAWREVHSDTEPYLIVSHGAVWLALQDVLEIPRFKIENCALIKIEGPKWTAKVLT